MKLTPAARMILFWVAIVAAYVLVFCALSGCQHPDGRKEAAATQGAITRTSAAVAAADAANARAQAHNATTRTLAEQIGEEAAQLLSSK